MNLAPLEDRIVVKPNAPEEITSGGLVIPQNAQEAPQQGVVVAVGPGRVLDSGHVAPMGVSVGDVVVYSKYGGTEVTVGAERLLVLSVRDVLATVTD